MKAKKVLLGLLKIIGVSAFWLCIWLLICYRVGLEMLFPTPLAVLRALFTLCSTLDFWKITFFSLVRVLAGIFISLILGSALAVMTEKSKLLNALLSPVLGVIKATPVASFIILALLWISKNTLPIFITALIVVPIVWSNVSEGLRSVDKNLVEVAKVYSFGKKDKIFKLYLPSVTPFFMAACKSSLGMAWKAGISAEVLSVPQNAIGSELYFSKIYFETDNLFAWTLVVIVLSVIIERLLVRALGALGKKIRALPGGNAK